MGRLEKEIRTYKQLLDALAEKPKTSVEELCAGFNCSESTLFRYLAVGEFELGDILWNGVPLARETIARYNLKKKEKATGKETRKSVNLSKLVDLLNRATPQGGLTIIDLAEKTGVSQRTIYRYLDILEIDLGLCIERPRKHSSECGRYKLVRVYLPSISPEKALFIYLSLLQQKGTALGVSIHDIKQALLATLTRNKYSIRDISLNNLESRIYIVDEVLANPDEVGEHLLKILEAVDKCITLRIKYFTAYRQETSVREVEPYGLICKHHNWYIVGKCLKKRGIRTFRIDQIEGVVPVGEKRFSYPKGFSITEYCCDSWGVYRDNEAVKVIIRFSAEVAYRVRKNLYHISQKIEEELSDGSIIVSYNLAGFTEFVAWLTKWGNKAEVVGPPELRERMCEFVDSLAQVYRR